MWNALYAEKYRLKFLQNLLEVKRDHTKYFKFLLKKGYVANMWNALYTEKYSLECLQKKYRLKFLQKNTGSNFCKIC